MSQVFNIIINGPENELPNLKDFDSPNTIWVGADRGCLQIIKHGFKISCAMGDFDSVTPEELELIKRHSDHYEIFPSDKVLTDFQIALNWVLKQKPKKINVFGWSGGRLDQYLSNIMTLTKLEYREFLTIIDYYALKNWIKVYLPGTWTIKNLFNFKYLCFTTLSDVKNLTLKNFRYNLNNVNLPFGKVMSSNEFVHGEPGELVFTDGIILVSQSRD